MTDTKIRLELAFLLLAVGLFIFFAPFVVGSKQPAIQASVKQNMDFLLEMAKKYTQNHKHPAANMDELVTEARDKRYNKTLFNPILRNSGDAIDKQLVEVYTPEIYRSLGPDFRGLQYAGKTGYYSDGVKFAIYGHLADGELLRDAQGRILALTND